jgi:hypothetical protein
MTVIDADDAAVLQQTGVHSRRRVQELQARMESLELDKARLEGELQRALSGRAMGAPAAVAAIPRPSSAPAPDLVEIPEPPIIAEAAPAPALPPSVERAPSAPEPIAVPAAESVIEEPASSAPDVSVVEEPVNVAQEDAPAPPRRRRPPTPDPEPATRPSPKPRPEDAWAASSEPVVRVPEAGAPDSDRDVLDVLERLVEPVSTGARSEDAASDMRTRLARTAAAKKPGSRSDERFDHPDHR